MTLSFKNESIINAPERVIAHGCNLKGSMGAGVALAIAERWPKVEQAYKYACVSGGLFLGFVNWAERGDGLYVANVMIQSTTGRDPKVRYASYDAIDKGLRSTLLEALERRYVAKGDAIATTALGTGLGNASWIIVRSIMRQASDDIGVDLNVYELNEQRFKELLP